LLLLAVLCGGIRNMAFQPAGAAGCFLRGASVGEKEWPTVCRTRLLLRVASANIAPVRADAPAHGVGGGARG